MGHDTTCWQEDERGTFGIVAEHMDQYDAVVWTRTGWDPPVPHAEQRAMLERAADAGVPTIGVHLDRWWGLGREGQVHEEPFFRVAHLFTADGGHDAEWAEAGVNHTWMPPAVSAEETGGGTYRAEMASDLAFVGSWRGYGHTEWTHRMELVDWLRANYGDRVRFWPEPGAPAVRGEALRDLYASVKVVVGDSCLAPNADGSPVTRYCSDRVPETVGRGAFLLHPWVEGVTDGTLYAPGVHIDTWKLWDWEALGAKIDYWLGHADERARVASQGQQHVREQHTYGRRMGGLLAAVMHRQQVQTPASLFD